MTALALVKASGASYRALHEIADRLEPKARKAFLDAVDALKGSVTLAELQDAIATGDADAVLRLLGWDQFSTALAGVTDQLRAAIQDAGATSAGALSLKFDLLNPATVNFIRGYELDLITGISDETRAGVRAIIENAFEQGGHPYQQARRIRLLIGLTEQQMNAVSNYWDTLLANGAPDARAETLAMQYYGRLLTYRARTIARTETIRAAGMGREATWAQAAEQGLLDPYVTRRQWLVTPDDRLCEVCAAIPDMNPDGVGLNEMFKSPDGYIDQEPAHPNCRCSVVLGELG